MICLTVTNDEGYESTLCKEFCIDPPTFLRANPNDDDAIITPLEDAAEEGISDEVAANGRQPRLL